MGPCFFYVLEPPNLDTRGRVNGNQQSVDFLLIRCFDIVTTLKIN